MRMKQAKIVYRSNAAPHLLLQQIRSSICMHLLLQKEFECHADGSKDSAGDSWTGSQQQQQSTTSSSSSGGSGMEAGSSSITGSSNTSTTTTSTTSRSSAALNKFREDLKDVLMSAGLSGGKETIFLVNDSQILDEQILEYADAIANTGEVGWIHSLGFRVTGLSFWA